MPTLPIADLQPFHGNPRRGNVHAIKESLARLGQFRPIVVNAGNHTGRPNEVLAGNHTMQAAKQLGWTELEAHLIDVDEDKAARIVAADNRIGDLGSYDDEALAELLSSLPDLDGTGYETADLDELLADTGPADDDEPVGSAPKQDAPSEPEEGFNRYEHRDEWEASGRRMVILDYPLPVYVWLQEQLAAIGQERGIEANADIILALVQRETGAEPPAAPDA